MKEIKDLTTESFGLIIAYFLPGLVGLFSLALWSDTIQITLLTFLTSNSNINLLLLVIFAALAIGMLVAAIRGFIYEYVYSAWLPSVVPGWFSQIFPSWSTIAHLGSNDFAALTKAEKLTAFKEIVDAHYRYHQCWGGMSIVMPILYVGWLVKSWDVRLANNSILPSMLLFLVVEAIAIWAATVAYDLYVKRSQKILQG